MKEKKPTGIPLVRRLKVEQDKPNPLRKELDMWGTDRLLFQELSRSVLESTATKSYSLVGEKISWKWRVPE